MRLIFLWFSFIPAITFDVDKKINDLCHFRFVPAPAQVLLSEEITGSLRKLKVAFLISIFKVFLLCDLLSILNKGMLHPCNRWV